MQRNDQRIERYQQNSKGKSKKPFTNHLLIQLLDQSYNQSANEQGKQVQKMHQQKQNYNPNLPTEISFGQIQSHAISKQQFEEQNSSTKQVAKRAGLCDEQTLDYYLSFDQESQMQDLNTNQTIENTNATNPNTNISNHNATIYEKNEGILVQDRVQQVKKIQYRLYKKQKVPQQQQDEDNQFKALKDKMTQIQYIASMEIKLLKQKLECKQKYTYELQQEIKRIKNKNQANESQKKVVNAQTMTQNNLSCASLGVQQDIRQQEIAVLKQALIRHVRINKYLTAHYKTVFDQKQLESLINKIQKQAL